MWEINNKLDRMVDRVKPWFMVHGFVHGLVYGLVHGLVSGTRFIVHGVFHNVLLEHTIILQECV